MTLCLSPDVRWLSPSRGPCNPPESLRYCGSPDGTVHLTRGETYCAEKGEALTAVAARVLEQNELSGPPEACALFFQPGLEALAHSGWDINLYRQDACWGDIGEMEGLTVLSLAAIYAAHYQQPCGWLARDPLNTLAIGIVKPDGQRQ